MTTLEKIKAEIQERIDKIGNDDYANGLAEAIIIHDKYAEQELKILDTIDFAIDASNGDTDYFVGFRNGLRYTKSLVDGEEPQYENCSEEDIQAYIDATPSVRPQEQTGHWTKDKEPWGGSQGWKCDKCNHIYDINVVYSKMPYNFCPNCGAKMVEPQESEDRNESDN